VSRTFRLFALALLGALAFGVAACGGSDNNESGGGGGGNAKSIKAAVVTDIGGLNDKGFNALAYKGLKDAEQQLGVDGRVLISKSNGDYIPNMTTAAQQGNKVVVANGYLMADALDTVASKVPNTNFAIIDYSALALKHKPKNVQGLLFKEQEAGYLVGYLAGLWAKDNNAKTISTVGGQKIPPVDHYIAGWQAGAKAADPGIQFLNAYSQDFVDQAKCKEIALDQISKGSKVVFEVAGNCGLGALDAVKEKGVQGIGVDNDLSYLGPHVMASALKKVDVAVFNAIKREQQGTFKGGSDDVATVKNGGVDIGKLGPAGQKYAKQVQQVKFKIGAGAIKNIPDTVK
jgi:basic membrane protein A